MDVALSIIGVIVLILIVWALLKFVLKMTARVVGCAVTLLIAVGIVVVGLVILL